MSEYEENEEPAKKINTSEESFIDKAKSQFDIFVASTNTFLKRSWIRTKEITRQTIDNIKRGTRATIEFLDHINIIQVLIALLLVGVGIFFSYREFADDNTMRILMYVMILAGVVLGCYAWIFLGQRYFGKILYYVVEQKYTRKIIAGGSFSFYEYKDPEEKTVMSRFTEPIGIIIISLITLLGIATAIIGIIRIISPDLDTASPILWGVLAIVSPVLATPILPIALMLDDAQVKSWNAKNHTTWTVSSKYKARLNSIISIGAILSNLREGFNVEGITNQIDILLSILKIGALVIFVTIGLIIIFYFVYFKNYLRQLTINSLSIDLYTLELKEVEGNQFGLEKQELVEEDEETEEVVQEEEAQQEDKDQGKQHEEEVQSTLGEEPESKAEDLEVREGNENMQDIQGETESEEETSDDVTEPDGGKSDQV